jgi:hypothetical protein
VVGVVDAHHRSTSGNEFALRLLLPNGSFRPQLTATLLLLQHCKHGMRAIDEYTSRQLTLIDEVLWFKMPKLLLGRNLQSGSDPLSNL